MPEKWFASHSCADGRLRSSCKQLSWTMQKLQMLPGIHSTAVTSFPDEDRDMIVKHRSGTLRFVPPPAARVERIISLCTMACTMLQKSALLGTALPAVRPTSARPQAMVRFYGSGGGELASTLHALCEIISLLPLACSAGCHVSIAKSNRRYLSLAWLRFLLLCCLLSACSAS